MSCTTEVWRSVVKGSVFSVHVDPSAQKNSWLLHVNMFFAVHFFLYPWALIRSKKVWVNSSDWLILYILSVVEWFSSIALL